MVDPKFFAFMSVDVQGFNSYNHCLIFYERFTQGGIHEDFDYGIYAEKLVRMCDQTDEDSNEGSDFGKAAE